MNINHLTPFRIASALYRAIRGLPPGKLPGGHSPATPAASRGTTSYVGLFEGVIESVAQPPSAHRPAAEARVTSAARASGFLRVEVDRKKKTTGSFMQFSDGRVLAGEMDGALQSGERLREASFRLAPARARHAGQSPQPAPVVAVGRLRIQSRDHRGVAAPGGVSEELTIRFVPDADASATPPFAG